LLYALLFSLPGSPVIYYGDELLMGDNLYLGDRDSVRTPMQWSPDRNGGFSRADFAQLYLPPLMDPVYGFSAVNVEAQQRSPSSFLHWIRSILQTRKQFPVFGTGSFEVVPCVNPSILAYVRSPHTEDPRVTTAVAEKGVRGGRVVKAGRAARATAGAAVGGVRGAARAGGAAPAAPRAGAGSGAGHSSNPVLCVHNLSRFAQPAELDLARWTDRRPVELLGRVPFPSVGGGTYGVTLGPYGFYWFELMEQGSGDGTDDVDGTAR
jgi:maltose alpha-D-glucosyltransferase/alpha-amylase